MPKGRKGFTLIELLIVVVIIGILAAIAIPKFSATREKAYFSSMKSDLKNLAAQQEIYYSSNQEYEYTSNKAEPLLGFSESSGVTVTIGNGASGSGWAATAVHRALDDASQNCGVFFGDDSFATDAGPATIAGVVTCVGE